MNRHACSFQSGNECLRRCDGVETVGHFVYVYCPGCEVGAT